MKCIKGIVAALLLWLAVAATAAKPTKGQLNNSTVVVVPVEEGGTCRPESAGRIWRAEVEPWLLHTLNEMESLSKKLLGKVSQGIADLEPQLDRSPMFHLKREEYMNTLIRNVQHYLWGVYNDSATAWSVLQAVSERHEHQLMREETVPGGWFSDPVLHQSIFNDLVEPLQEVEKSHDRSAAVVRSLLEELSTTVKAIVMNTLTILMETLRIQNLNEDDTSRLLGNNIGQMAPDFLGMLLQKVAKKGTDLEGLKPINKNLLGPLEDIYYKMHGEVIELADKCFPAPVMPRVFDNYWKSQNVASHYRVRTWPPIDYELDSMYDNDEFLSEVTLALMASFKFPEETTNKTEQ